MERNHNGQCVILFYKYLELTDNKEILELFRVSIELLCDELGLLGRVLIGLSKKSEGINGSLSGLYHPLLAFTVALLGQNYFDDKIIDNTSVDNSFKKFLSEPNIMSSLTKFWQSKKLFAEKANIDLPFEIMKSSSDFKWTYLDSESNSNNPLIFPDLKVCTVNELIGTGAKLSNITIEQTSVGYLSPSEFHEALEELNSCRTEEENNTILIDCRNNIEYSIGHFKGAVNPNTKTFNEFPLWVEKNKSSFENKKVLMYCTGGIRCEKASAFIRNETNANNVQHIQGGIHRYIELYGSKGFFHGKNFVFDKRRYDDPSTFHSNLKSKVEQKNHNDDTRVVVGKCQYCSQPWDEYNAVCTVCRTMTLVCPSCAQQLRGEYHCPDHFFLKDCYFTDLSIFTKKELQQQLVLLQQSYDNLQGNKKYKSKRRTIQKKIQQITTLLETDDNERNHLIHQKTTLCRGCGNRNCFGNCWAFYGLGTNNASTA